MGIPSYFSYIVKNHSEIIKKLNDPNENKKININNLYLDCNSIIYDVIHFLNKIASLFLYPATTLHNTFCFKDKTCAASWRQ